jgi:hypothetical protein
MVQADQALGNGLLFSAKKFIDEAEKFADCEYAKNEVIEAREILRVESIKVLAERSK